VIVAAIAAYKSIWPLAAGIGTKLTDGVSRLNESRERTEPTESLYSVSSVPFC
jgi:hypothetical protein